MPAARQTAHSLIPECLLGVLLAILIGSSLWSWHALQTAEQQQTLARLKLETSALAERIESRFDQQITALERLAERWPVHRDTPDLWRHDALMLTRDYSSFQAIQWLDPDLRIRWTEPLIGNEAALGFQYSPEHPGYPVLMQIRDTLQPALSPLFELRQGGPGLTYYVPVVAQRSQPPVFDGFLIGVFRPQKLLAELTGSIGNRHLILDFSTAGERLFIHQPDTLADHLPAIQMPLRLANRSDILLTARPSQSLVRQSQTHLPEMVLFSGVLTSLLLVSSLWLLLGSRRKAKALRISNRRLQSEIAHRLDIEQSLQASQSKLQLILDMTDHSKDALFLIGLQPTEVIYMNRTCWVALGYSEHELRDLLRIAPQDVMCGYGKWIDSWQTSAAHAGASVSQQTLRHRNGHTIPVEISTRALSRHCRDYLICIGRNNAAQLEAAEQLRRQSQQDGLTGLFNRRYFDQALASEWRRQRRQQQPLALLMLDVDHFKSFNDLLGHQAGDDALRKLASALGQGLMREGECACRYGGEEFAVILPGADAAECERAAKHLHRAIERLQIAHPGSPLQRLTVSIGAASLMPMAELSPSDLIRLADQALYQAKSQGRNRTCHAEQEQH